MNKNTLIGLILLVGLFIWSMSLSTNRAKEAQAVAAQKAKTEQSEKQRSGALRTPELSPLDSANLVPATLAPAAKTPEVAADSVKDSSVALAPIARQKIKVETEHFTAVFDNRGAKITSVVVKALKDSAGNYPEIIADTTLGALALKVDGVDLSEQMFSVPENTPDFIRVERDTALSFTFQDPNGNKIIRHFAFTPKGVSIQQKIFFEGFKPNDYELLWLGGMKETEEFPKGKSFGGGSYFFSEVVFNDMVGVERETVRDREKFNAETGKMLWAGMRRKYVAAVIKFPEASEATLLAEHFTARGSDSKDPGTYKLTVSDNMNGANSLAFDFMILPLNWQDIKSFDLGFEKIIVSGWSWCGADVWFVALCGFLLWLLKFFYSIIPNYGVGIILITILVRMITTPLTLKQLRSTSAMSKLKPEIDAINVKYRSDPQKKQAAILELYTKNHINPMASCTGGCLPMLIQMPIFFALFMVFGRAIELRGMPFIGWITDLSRSDVIWNGITIPFIMPDGIAILPIVMVFTTYFQTKQSMSSMTDPAQQKMMVWMMPIMMFLFSAVMPSGLVLYWIISNLWGSGQYALVNRARRKVNELESGKLKGKNVQDAVIVKKK